MGQVEVCRELGRIPGVMIVECKGWRIRGAYRVIARIRDQEIGFVVFTGRESYSPWVEFNDTEFSEGFYNALEEILPQLLGIFGEGLRIMIPYVRDHETLSLLGRGIHPGATRLGSLMIVSGYYLVRDMYYPEGFAEGSPKLVGEGYVGNKWYLESLLEELRMLREHLSKGCGDKDPSCLYAERSLRAISSVLERIGYR
ncbi:MAG TPA: DUF1122 family protein [Sulfolobales archaeon]|nr:DUF1122 family protein [Sulfolobales archaeon]